MKKIINKLTLTSLLLGAALLVSGCLQQDTTGDTAQQEKNRQNAAADVVAADYTPIKGQYSGEYNGSSVLLTLDVARQNSTGNGDASQDLVPQPTFIGNMNLTPAIFVSNEGKPLTIPYAVTAGQVADGNDLTLSVQENGSATTLHCKVASENELDCNWYVHSSSTAVASFTLTRVIPGQASANSSADFGGTYIGSNADYQSIKAQFQTVLSPQSGSLAVPQVSIAGSFSFNGVNFTFKDSEYDPISNTLAINISGDNPIVVNCVVESASSLHCTWLGTHGTSSYENFDLTKDTK